MRAAIFAAMLAMASGVPAVAATFVYVSNAEDGDIGMYTLQPDGSLQPGQRFKAEKLAMPLAVSPDKRFLIAAVRSKPYQAYSYDIDPKSGALATVGTGPLAESFPYIWPEAARTNVTGPLKSCDPPYVVRHGAMRSSRVERKKLGTSTF